MVNTKTRLAAQAEQSTRWKIESVTRFSPAVVAYFAKTDDHIPAAMYRVQILHTRDRPLLYIRLVFAIIPEYRTRAYVASRSVPMTDWNTASRLQQARYTKAAALGLNAFGSSDFADRVAPGKADRLTVAVTLAKECHEVRVGDLEDWLRCNGKSPREQALKVRLRQTLAAGTWEEQA